MYPDLSYLFHDLFGSDVDNGLSIFKTFGLFVVFAILTAAFLLHKELKRRSETGQFVGVPVKIISGQPMDTKDYVLNAIFGFIIGFKGLFIYQHFAEMQTDPSGVILSGKGSWLGGFLGAILLSAYYYWRDRDNRGKDPEEKMVDLYPHHRIADISTVAVVSGVIGAKVFTIIEDLPAFFADPIGNLLSGDGWTIYGGLIGGFVGVTWYLRRKNIPVLPVIDAVAPGLIVSYGVGRMGCHFAGDGDWGIEAAAQPDWWFLPDWLWAYDYPRNVLNRGEELADCVGQYCHHLVPPVYPTSVYETMMAFAIGGILWSLRKRLEFVPGLLFCVYMIFNGFERFFIEKIRVNARYDFMAGLTQAEFIAVSLVLAGLLWGAWLWRRNQHASTSGEDA